MGIVSLPRFVRLPLSILVDEQSAGAAHLTVAHGAAAQCVGQRRN